MRELGGRDAQIAVQRLHEAAAQRETVEAADGTAGAAAAAEDGLPAMANRAPLGVCIARLSTSARWRTASRSHWLDDQQRGVSWDADFDRLFKVVDQLGVDLGALVCEALDRGAATPV